MCPLPLYKQELYNSDLSEGLVQNVVPGAKVQSKLGNIKEYRNICGQEVARLEDSR